MRLGRRVVLACLCVGAFRASAVGADGNPRPTLADVPYGKGPRQVLDFWKAESNEPTPLVLYVHGGSWVGGGKEQIFGLRKTLAAGISFVSVEYRLIASRADMIQPPVAWPMHDVARALQFVRSKAAEWHVDTTRICALGSSAGGTSALWLAFHDDMADRKSSDPVARESTRLTCVATVSAQTTLDPLQMKAWIPGIDYGGHAFGIGPDAARGLTRFENFLAQRDRLAPWIEEYSPYELVTSDDPPVYLWYATAPSRRRVMAPKHSANFGVRLKQKLDAAGVECEFVYPRAPGVVHHQASEFVIAKLKPAQTAPAPAR